MPRFGKGQAERFALAYLRTLDLGRAARECGRRESASLLAEPAVVRALTRQRRLLDEQLCTQDVVRRMAALAFGRANDCVKLALEEAPDVDALDLDLLAEMKRSERGAIEIRLIDRVQLLRELAALTAKPADGADDFFRAMEEHAGPSER